MNYSKQIAKTRKVTRREETTKTLYISTYDNPMTVYQIYMHSHLYTIKFIQGRVRR